MQVAKTPTYPDMLILTLLNYMITLR